MGSRQYRSTAPYRYVRDREPALGISGRSDLPDRLAAALQSIGGRRPPWRRYEQRSLHKPGDQYTRERELETGHLGLRSRPARYEVLQPLVGEAKAGSIRRTLQSHE